jgi:hypothetical protein
MNVGVDLLKNWTFLLLGAVLQNSLNNAATVSKQIIEISKKFGLNLRMSRQ